MRIASTLLILAVMAQALAAPIHTAIPSWRWNSGSTTWSPA